MLNGPRSNLMNRVYDYYMKLTTINTDGSRLFTVVLKSYRCFHFKVWLYKRY